MMLSGMRFLSRRVRLCLFMIACLAVVLSAAATVVRTEEPPVFAITNAKIIPVAGSPIEKGTIIVRRGIIESVGANVTIPTDARTIDATGLTVYPGLIDAFSDIGLEEQAPARQTTPAATTPTQGRGLQQAQQQQQQPTIPPDERQGLTPYRQAFEQINPTNRKIESARAAGITTTLVVPRRGFFPGQSTLVNLGGSEVGQMVVKAPMSFFINTAGRGAGAGGGGGGGGGGYPGSLMGIFAFVKQTLLDAGQYATAWSIYKANPGAARPEYSRALEALQPVLKREMPVVMPANTPAEIQRALDLADSFKLNLVLEGCAEGGKIASLLKSRSIPVLLAVKYPERPTSTDPDFREELESLRRRVEAPANAAALAKAGVRFAFVSDDMANPRDFILNVSRAIEAGLDKDTALRALTLNPAELLGLSDRLGTIEKNKTANLILATGDIFDQKTRVKYAFVDGRKYDIVEQPAQPAAPGRQTPGR
jgi:imidazolonepropionase-like amidohydrolase